MMHELMKQHSRKLYPFMSGPFAAAQTANSQIVTAGGHPVQPPHAPVPLIHSEDNGCDDDIWATKMDEDIEILFTYEGWSIERWKEAPKSDADWISHYCPSYGWRFRTDQWTLMADGICEECCQTVPEEILGVWKLKNFDNLVSTDVARRDQTPFLHGPNDPMEDPYEYLPWRRVR